MIIIGYIARHIDRLRWFWTNEAVNGIIVRNNLHSRAVAVTQIIYSPQDKLMANLIALECRQWTLISLVLAILRSRTRIEDQPNFRDCYKLSLAINLISQSIVYEMYH